jgi:hypothetical protein
MGLGRRDWTRTNDLFRVKNEPLGHTGRNLKLLTSLFVPVQVMHVRWVLGLPLVLLYNHLFLIVSR